MSGIEVSEELAKQVEAKTGKSDVEQGVWQLLYQGRGRYAHDEATGTTSRASD